MNILIRSTYDSIAMKIIFSGHKIILMPSKISTKDFHNLKYTAFIFKAQMQLEV